MMFLKFVLDSKVGHDVIVTYPCIILLSDSYIADTLCIELKQLKWVKLLKSEYIRIVPKSIWTVVW